MPEMPPPTRSFVNHLGVSIPYDDSGRLAWRVSAYAVVVRNDAILLVEPAWASRWELPGGGIDLERQETLVEGVCRECWEETGYRLRPDAEGPQFDAETFFYLDDPPWYCHSLLFTVRGTVSDLPDPVWRRDPREIEAVRWMPLASLTEGDMHQPHWEMLRRLNLV